MKQISINGYKRITKHAARKRFCGISDDAALSRYKKATEDYSFEPANAVFTLHNFGEYMKEIAVCRDRDEFELGRFINQNPVQQKLPKPLPPFLRKPGTCPHCGNTRGIKPHSNFCIACGNIFDYLGNFEFFRQDPKGKESDETTSLAEYTFKLKVMLIRELQDMKFQESELIEFRKGLVKDVSGSIASLNQEQFQVKQNLKLVEKYADSNAFQYIGVIESADIISHLAGLVPVADDDETARRLDALMYKLAIAHATGDENSQRSIINRVKTIARNLEPKATIPQVLERREMIKKVQQDSFWASATLLDIEEVRQQLRDLMQYLKKEMRAKIINVTDSVLLEKEGERFAEDPAMEGYYQRAERYVKENEGKPAIHKLKNNEALSVTDWDELEKIFWHEVGTEKEYEAASNGVSLGRFIRGITGLSHEAALTAFSEFLDSQVFTEQQITFVRYIIEWITRWGTLMPEDMKDDEFAGGADIFEIFDDNLDAFQRIRGVIETINANAMRLVA